MTKLEALEKLEAGESLSTGMCEAFGISMDGFLRFAQLDDKLRANIQKKLAKEIRLHITTEELGHCSQ